MTHWFEVPEVLAIVEDLLGVAARAGRTGFEAVAERLRKYIFSVGNTVDPAEAYRAFRGRDPKIDALMQKRGFSKS